jgi:hypothetical protein
MAAAPHHRPAAGGLATLILRRAAGARDAERSCRAAPV